MFCTKCGTMAEDDQLFCTNCGSPLEQVEVVFPEATPATQPVSGATQPAAISAKPYPAAETSSAHLPISSEQPKSDGKRTGLIAAVAAVVLVVAVVAGMAIAKIGPFSGGGASGSSTTSVTLGESDDAINEQSQQNIDAAGVSVPDYTGMTREDAEADIVDAGLTVSDVTESYSDVVAAGCVTEQGIAAGERVDKGTSMSLVVSKGPAPHTYTIVEQPMTWAEAESYCESQGGYLACITSQEENEQVKSMIADSSCTLFWIGAQRNSPGGFTWVTGEDMTFTEWAAGEPNNEGGNENVVAIFQTVDGVAWYDTLNDVSAYYRPTTMAFVMEKVEE